MEGGAVAVALDTDARLMVAGEGAVKETTVTGMATGDCMETVEGVEGAVLFWDGGADVIRVLPTGKHKVVFTNFACIKQLEFSQKNEYSIKC